MTDHERDDHLLAALRHAPDRDVAPPAAVSEAILRQAQAATQSPTPVRPAPVERSARTDGWWANLSDGFNSLLRPAPAAAFGTLAVASIIGLMWASQEPPGVAEETPVVTKPSSLQKSAPYMASAPAAAPAADIAVVAQTPPTPPTVAIVKAAPPKPKPPPPHAPAAVAVPSTPRPAEPALDVGQNTAVATAPAPAAPAPAPAPVRAVPALESAAPAAARADAADAVSRGAAAPALQSSATEATAGPAARQRSMAETSASQRVGRSGASPLVSALALLNAVGSDAQWMSPQGKLVAHSAAQQQWLAEINRSTANVWQRVSGGEASPPSGVPWTLRQRDSAVGSLWLEGAALWWRDARGVLFTAPAPEEQVRGWIEAAKGW